MRTSNRLAAFASWTSLAVVAALAAACSAAPAAPASSGLTGKRSPATAAPSVTVRPDGGLRPGQQVSVVVDGFRAEAKVFLSECLTGADASSVGCGEQLAGQLFTITDAHGHGSTRFTVSAGAAPGYLKDAIPCHGRCVLVATDGYDDPYATAPLQLVRPALALMPVRSSPSCANLRPAATVGELVSAFRASRLRQQGTAGCLTTSARKVYCDSSCSQSAFRGSPGPVCLYRCGGARVVAIALDAWHSKRLSARRWYVALVVTVSSPSGVRHRLFEYLTVQRRTAVRQGRPGWTVTSASPV